MKNSEQKRLKALELLKTGVVKRLRCSAYGRYKAILKPRCGCMSCWVKWIEKQNKKNIR